MQAIILDCFSVRILRSIEIGGLTVSDPLDKDVIDWWKNVLRIYMIKFLTSEDF